MDHRETIGANYVYNKNIMIKESEKNVFKNGRKFIKIRCWNTICKR